MKRLHVWLAGMMFLCCGAAHSEGTPKPTLFDVRTGEHLSIEQALPTLKKSRIVLVGELHSEKSHHLAQLRVIRLLAEHGLAVAVGLEMFRTDSQEKLDQWVDGRMDERAFREAYYENWNMPWPLYEMIFNYARLRRIPLAGLNVPSEITRQVARSGFRSLTKEQRGQLRGVTCDVGPEYMEFIKKAFGAHAHGDLDFTYFCEAQLVWDTAMAINALEYLEKHPATMMVILAGTAHAMKRGIPSQIQKRSRLPVTVILPEITDRIQPGIVEPRDGDYIIAVTGTLSHSAEREGRTK
jgi:uncharacterized iron-regulated protein